MGVSLNPAQRAAVEHGDGPLLVLAGAGSGKTRVITHRIARLVDRGVQPKSILAVSFTNKAAAEMGERMIPLVGRNRADKLWLSTFHSFGVRFLTEEARALGYPGRFVIFDQGDATGLVREIVRREGLADRKLDLYSVHARISLWKNKGIEPDAVPESDFEYDAIARDVYPHYQAGLANMCAVDFDDLVAAPARILAQREDIREKWRQRFRYMLVDEFQDTNLIQLELVRLLANERGNVTVVGDDDQSIYGWRGAEVGNILDFESHFKGAKIVKLETNYRSKTPILEIANEAIARSKRQRHEKVLRAFRGEGPKVKLCTLPDAEAEAKLVVHEIRRVKKEGQRLGSVAVLYRSNLQARPIEEELRASGLPYRLFGGTKLFDRKEVKDAVAYLRAVVHPRDELSLRRIVNYPARQIGDATIRRITQYALARDIAFVDALARIDLIPDVPAAARRGAGQLLMAVAAARRKMDTGDLVGAARDLFRDVGLERHFREAEAPAMQKRWGNIEYVIRSLERFKNKGGAKATLAGFLTRLTLDLGSEEEKTGERITLSSLHASKGLEFDVVFFIGLNEGQLPHSRTLDPKVTEAAPTDVEEERRLFYVGVTRARDQLYLTRPRQRALRGRTTPLVHSRFLEGLPEEFLEHYEAVMDAPLESNEAAAIGKALLDTLRGD